MSHILSQMIGSVTLCSIAYFTSTENIKVPHTWLFVIRIHEWSVDNGLVIWKASPCHYIAIRTRCIIYTLRTNFRSGCSDTNVDTIYITCDLFCAIKRACFNVAHGISYYTRFRCIPMTYCRNTFPFILNTVKPRQDGRRFADDTFKRIFLNENVRISIKISLKSVPKGPINNIPELVQIMAWRRSSDKPLSEPMMVSSPTHICVTRPQWVNRYDTEFILKNIRSSFLNTKMHQDIWGRLSIKYRLTSKEHTILLLTQESQTWKTAFPSVWDTGASYP